MDGAADLAAGSINYDSRAGSNVKIKPLATQAIQISFTCKEYNTEYK